jgi:4'-phosphopantetheinyl transferase
MSAAPQPRSVVDVWSVELASAAACERRLSAVLNRDERARAARFVMPNDRLRYRVAHGALRTILGGCAGAAPAGLRFARGEHGKPLLAGGPHFSLSHSGAIALVAVSYEREVGVDVEEVRPVPDACELARRYLATLPARRIVDAPDAQRDRLFMTAWTAIEAILKAEGTGLTGIEQRFDLCDLGEHRVRATIAGLADSPTWTVRHLALAAGHVGAIAVRDADFEVRTHRFA